MLFKRTRKERAEARFDAEGSSAMMKVAPAFRAISMSSINLYESDQDDDNFSDCNSSINTSNHSNNNNKSDFNPWCERYPVSTARATAAATGISNIQSTKVMVDTSFMDAEEEQQPTTNRRKRGVRRFLKKFVR